MEHCTNPTTTVNTKTSDGSGGGAFTSNLSTLLGNTKYYVRAYATNNMGTAYGNEISFTTTTNLNSSLDSKWLTSAGNGITISGTSAIYYSFSSSWKEAQAKGLITIGATAVKNISKVSANTWTCLMLGIQTRGGVPVQSAWSYNGTLTMSNDGKSITISANTMIDGVSKPSTSVFIRQ